jgi:DnaJ family protein C protein 7
MGFPLELCAAADENHVAEFICAICTSLVDGPVLTPCSHVFCASCLEQWLSQHGANQRCPTCAAALTQASPPLQQASPLGWRVLGRVRVCCPLKDCAWRGEYSEVHAHLTSSQSHVGGDGGVAAESASGLREQAEIKAEARQFKEAITLFSKSIAGCPHPASFVGRGRAWAALAQPTQALDDARSAIALDVAHQPAHALLALTLVQTGRFSAAHDALERVVVKDAELDAIESHVEALVAAERDALAAFDAGEFGRARELFAQVLHNCSAAPELQLWLSRAELATGQSDQAIRRTREVLRDDPNNGKAYAVRGIAYYLQGDFEQAWKHLQEALRLDPDDALSQGAAKKARKVQRAAEGAKSAAFHRRFEEAVELSSVAIEAADAPMRAPLRALLFAERAAARLRLKEFERCLEDAAQALYGSDNDCKSAALTRASALHALGRHEEALSDMTAMLRLYEHDVQIKTAYHRANFEVRKMRRPDLYGLLRVASVASAPEIRAAYRQQALVLHPDKVPMDDLEGKKKAEANFKALGEALEILTDDFKRKLWDEGYDREAIEERQQAAQRAAREHTRDGCCGGGGGCR